MVSISIIVPVYKTEKYLNRCIESILNQTFTDFELILVDDGSPDNCPQICDEWVKKDVRIRAIHKSNGGASSARNVGLTTAKGKWITFVDSDDWIETNALETLYELAQEYKVPMVISGMQVSKVPIVKPKESKIKETVIKWSQTDLLNRFFRVNGEPDVHRVWGAIVRRDILKDYRFIEGIMNEDIEACYYLARKCEAAVYIDIPLYDYFLNVEGVTNSRFDKKKLDLLKVWDIVREQISQFTPEYKYACEMNCKRARLTLLTQMYLNGYDYNDPFMKETKQRLKKEVRASFWDLMSWKMPISRKILVCFLMLL